MLGDIASSATVRRVHPACNHVVAITTHSPASARRSAGYRYCVRNRFASGTRVHAIDDFCAIKTVTANGVAAARRSAGYRNRVCDRVTSGTRVHAIGGSRVEKSVAALSIAVACLGTAHGSSTWHWVARSRNQRHWSVSATSGAVRCKAPSPESACRRPRARIAGVFTPGRAAT